MAIGALGTAMNIEAVVRICGGFYGLTRANPVVQGGTGR